MLINVFPLEKESSVVIQMWDICSFPCLLLGTLAYEGCREGLQLRKMFMQMWRSLSKYMLTPCSGNSILETLELTKDSRLAIKNLSWVSLASCFLSSFVKGSRSPPHHASERLHQWSNDGKSLYVASNKLLEDRELAPILQPNTHKLLLSCSLGNVPGCLLTPPAPPCHAPDG